MTKSSFREQVRLGKVKHPTQRGFRPDDWTSAYLKTDSSSDVDRRLYEAGIWFFQEFEKVRETLEEFKHLKVPGNQSVQVHVGAVNFFVCSMLAERRDRLSELMRGGSETSKPLHDSNNGEQITTTVQSALAAQIESIVDSARFAFSAAARDRHEQEINEEFDDDEALAKVKIRLNLASLYHALERLWGECLWNGWYIRTAQNADLISPVDMEFAKVRAVGGRRWDEMVTELGILSFLHWSHSSLELRRMLCATPRIMDVVEERGRERFVVGLGDPLSEHPPTEHLVQIAAQELYLRDVLPQQLPNLPGLALKDLVAAWGVLAPLADIALSRFPEPKNISQIREVLEYCPTFERSSIKRALIEALNVTDAQAEQILSIFTFSANWRDDLWQKPFVPITDNLLSPVVSALQSPNLLRSIEQWMKVGGLDLKRRGKPFEQFVRNYLAERSILRSFEVARSSVQVGGTSGEEIDLAARLGGTVIVGEMKCSVQPSEPIEVHRYFRVLEDAADQAKRKAQFVEGNLGIFLRAAGFDDLEGRKPKVIPVVVTNQPLGAGYLLNDVPVVDPTIFKRFVEGGKLLHGVRYRADGEAVALSQTTLYTSESEAEQVLQDYLRTPPQLQGYEHLVEAEFVPLLRLSEGSKPVGFIETFVALPEVVSLPQQHDAE